MSTYTFWLIFILVNVFSKVYARIPDIKYKTLGFWELGDTSIDSSILQNNAYSSGLVYQSEGFHNNSKAVKFPP